MRDTSSNKSFCVFDVIELARRRGFRSRSGVAVPFEIPAVDFDLEHRTLSSHRVELCDVTRLRSFLLREQKGKRAAPRTPRRRACEFMRLESRRRESKGRLRRRRGVRGSRSEPDGSRERGFDRRREVWLRVFGRRSVGCPLHRGWRDAGLLGGEREERTFWGSPSGRIEGSRFQFA